LTLLASAIGIVPIAFIKIAENEVGDIDYKLSPAQTVIYDGNYNYYDYLPPGFADTSSTSDESSNSTLEAILRDTSDLVQVDGDHVSIMGFNFLYFPAIEEAV